MSLFRRYGILKKRGATVTVPESLGASRVMSNLGQPARDGSPAPIIDVLHRAVRDLASAVIVKRFVGFPGDACPRDARMPSMWWRRRLLSALQQYPDDEERQMLENYLQGSDNFPAASQPRLIPFVD